jgi:hypothetical protein
MAPPLQNLSSEFPEAPPSFISLLSSPDFVPYEPPYQTLTPDPTFPAVGGYFLLWPIYFAAVTRVSQPIHCVFAINVLNYIGENMGIRQASNMASFLQAHPAFRGRGMEKVKEGGVMGDINDWRMEGPMQLLREMFEREGESKS